MGRSAKDFFKPYIVPRSRVPAQQAEEDEIIVRSPSRKAQGSASASRRQACDKASPSRHSVRTKLSPQKSQLSRESSRSSLEATPRQPSSRESHRKPSAVSSLHGSNDDDDSLYHSSPTPSIQRTVMAVQVPPPRRGHPPPPTTQSAPTMTSMPPPPALNTSFNSIVSSQSSSRRIIKGGMQAVTNSDSGSAEDSDEELDDLDILIPRKKARLTPPAPPPITTSRSEKSGRKSARLSDHSNKSSRSHTPQLPPSPPRTEYKHSLLRLVKANEKKVKEDARLAEAEQRALDAEEKRERQRQAAARTMDEEMLVEKYADDSEEGEGVKRAMLRTEALLDEERFPFFGSGGRVRVKARPFPVDCLEGTSLVEVLGHEKTRQRAYVTGFVADLAIMDRVPVDVLKWTASQLVHETRDDLREAYVEALRVARDIDVEYDWSTLREVYTTTVSAIGRTSSPTAQSDTSAEMDHAKDKAPGLRHVVRALPHLLRRADVPALTTAILDLALLNIDATLARDTDLHIDIERSLDEILSTIPMEQLIPLSRDIAIELQASPFLSTILLCQVITSLPATSEATHFLRRQLALRHSTDKWRDEVLVIEDCYKPILDRLRTADAFKIHGNTDHNLLKHQLEVLDLAIDAGFSTTFDFLPPTSSSSSSSPSTTPPETSTNPSNPLIFPRNPTAPSQTPRERNFNAQIDALVAQLKSLASRIKDAGATSLARVECKSLFERVIVRLEYGVRTRPKPKRDVFGGGGWMEGGRRGMEGFVNGKTVSWKPIGDGREGRMVEAGEDDAGEGGMSMV